MNTNRTQGIPDISEGFYVQDRTEPNLYVPSAIDDYDLHPNSFRVLCHLKRRAGVSGAYPSYQSIGDVCFRSAYTSREVRRRKAIEAVKDLKCRNIIEVQKRQDSHGAFHSNIYAINPFSEWGSDSGVTRGSERSVTRGSELSVTRVVTQESLGVVTPESPKGNPIESTPIEGTPKKEIMWDGSQARPSHDRPIAPVDRCDRDPEPSQPETPVSPAASEPQVPATPKTKKSGAAARRSRLSQKAAETYAALEESGYGKRFEAFWKWYREKVCAISGSSCGDKVAAADAFLALLAEPDFDLERFKRGCSAYWKKADQAGGVGIPHAAVFLLGKRDHPTPYWEAAIEASEPATAEEFISAEIGDSLSPLAGLVDEVPWANVPAEVRNGFLQYLANTFGFKDKSPQERLMMASNMLINGESAVSANDPRRRKAIAAWELFLAHAQTAATPAEAVNDRRARVRAAGERLASIRARAKGETA